jgi:23S rRNA pseudouridine2605 synthase
MTENNNNSESAAPGTRVTLVRAFTKKGVGSRTQAREWILNGRVRVNGQIQRFLYFWVDLTRDVIALDDQPIGDLEQKHYLLLNKPDGYLTTRVDQQGRPTIYDLLPSFATWIFPAGRLDMDSDGLLFLTNDGPLADWLINPDSGVAKTYYVKLERTLQENDRRLLQEGIQFPDYRTRPAEVTLAKERPGNWVRIKICEGKNRQVRRMLEFCGYTVKKLIRTRIGPLKLGDLAPGKWRNLTDEELQALQTMRNAPPASPAG